MVLNVKGARRAANVALAQLAGGTQLGHQKVEPQRQQAVGQLKAQLIWGDRLARWAQRREAAAAPRLRGAHWIAAGTAAAAAAAAAARGGGAARAASATRIAAAAARAAAPPASPTLCLAAALSRGRVLLTIAALGRRDGPTGSFPGKQRPAARARRAAAPPLRAQRVAAANRTFCGGGGCGGGGGSGSGRRRCRNCFCLLRGARLRLPCEALCHRSALLLAAHARHAVRGARAALLQQAHLGFQLVHRVVALKVG